MERGTINAEEMTMSPEEFVERVSDPINSLGALHYFGPKAKEAADSLGLGLYRFYFAGRGGVLGNVSSSIIQSAFGYFNPTFVDKIWTTAKQRCNVSEAATAQLSVAHNFSEKHFSKIDDLEEATAAMAKLTSQIDIAGLPLFAGFRDAPIPESTPSAFMHHVILMRELRGSVHLGAVRATGCRTRVAHQLHRPNEQELFGYNDKLDISPEEQLAYSEAEPLTNASMERHGTLINADERNKIVSAIDAAVLAWV